MSYYRTTAPRGHTCPDIDRAMKDIQSMISSIEQVRDKLEDVKGFCKAAKIAEVEKSGYVLTPGRYVGSDYVEEDDGVFEEKMGRLTKEISEQFKQSKGLEERIKKNLKDIGFSL